MCKRLYVGGCTRKGGAGTGVVTYIQVGGSGVHGGHGQGW